MFKDSAWTYRYFKLISHARKRTLTNGYSEMHHVIPKCMGGNNDSTNLVKLTAREHLVAHKILVRCCKTEFHRKLLFALWAMAVLKNKHTNQRAYLTSREYSKLREEYFTSRRGIPLTDETKNKISQALTGNKIPEHVIQKRSATLTKNLISGKTQIRRNKLTDEQKILRKQKIAESFTEERRNHAIEKMKLSKSNWSEEEKLIYSKKLSIANTGKIRSEEQRTNISKGLLASPYQHSEETKLKISNAQLGKVKDPLIKFVLKTPTGEIIERVSKAADICKEFNIGVKYFYLSLKKKLPIQSGKAKGWQLLSKEKL